MLRDFLGVPSGFLGIYLSKLVPPSRSSCPARIVQPEGCCVAGLPHTIVHVIMNAWFTCGDQFSSLGMNVNPQPGADDSTENFLWHRGMRHPLGLPWENRPGKPLDLVDPGGSNSRGLPSPSSVGGTRHVPRPPRLEAVPCEATGPCDASVVDQEVQGTIPGRCWVRIRAV